MDSVTKSGMAGSNLESAGPVDDSDDFSEDVPKTEEELYMYHMSHARGQFILGRIESMLACRGYFYLMFHARKRIKYSRKALLHKRCAEILDGEDVSEANLYLVRLFEKYLPIVGALSSSEYRKLLDGIDLVPSPSEPVEAGGICRACRNLNLRRESFQMGSSRFVSSAMGDLALDGDYSDEDLEKKVPCNSATPGTVSHHRLGDLLDIAKRPKCPICRLITDCFQRLSAEELGSYGYGLDRDEWLYGGVVWLSLLHDPIGDHEEYSHSRRQDDNPSVLESTELSDRMRLILTVLPQGKKPENADFQSPMRSLHTEIFAITNEGDTNFQVYKQAAPFIDMIRPQKWLHACETFHGKACSAPANYGKMEVHEDMLLIDMEDDCLVSGFKGRRYLALSYVWGAAQHTTFQTRLAVLENLMKPGSLSTYLGEIATTITQAMQVTREMKCRYLWVDALCIVQDDEESKPYQINHMDAIYRQAILTIVAGDGLSAEFEIYGLGPNPRETIQRTYSLRSGLALTANEAIYGDIEVEVLLSQWASRAWTFQERILSRRFLIFVNSTVHWSCSCLRWSEAEHNPSEEGPSPWVYYNEPIFHDSPTLYMKGPQLPGENSINFVWQNVVKTFTGLTLTYERDVLLAIAGLESYIAQYFDTSYIFGHPQKNFLDFLLWFPRFGGVRRRDALRIPSWSWASWVPNVWYPQLEPLRKKYPKLRIPTPTWDNASTTRVSMSCPHLGVLDLHTMISKVRIFGSMRYQKDVQVEIECPEVGWLMQHSMPLAVLNEAGKCIGRASVSKGVDQIDGEFEAIVIADKSNDVKANSVVVLTYWIMIIEWKGEVAERIGLGVITAESWSKANPVWRDVELG